MNGTLDKWKQRPRLERRYSTEPEEGLEWSSWDNMYRETDAGFRDRIKKSFRNFECQYQNKYVREVDELLKVKK